MATSSSVYASFPLQHGVSLNIRVIEIIDEVEPQGLLRCKFHIIPVDGPVSFTALSYTWGSPADVDTIEVNGETVQVRRNLWDFLHEARRREVRPERLWIDALCIDQSNVKERNHQVGMMGEIYSKAEKTVVWLGARWPGATKEFPAELPGVITAAFQPRDHHAITVAASRLFGDLGNRPYWRRLWIFQEFVLAKIVSIWCAYATFGECTLRKVWRRPLQFGQFPDGLNKVLVYRSIYHDSVRLKFPSSPMSLPVLLLMWSFHMECENPRDRIYALLSLVNRTERESLALEPDYSLTPAELLTEFYHRISSSQGEAVANMVAPVLVKLMHLEDDDKINFVRRIIPDFDAKVSNASHFADDFGEIYMDSVKKAMVTEQQPPPKPVEQPTQKAMATEQQSSPKPAETPTRQE